MPKVVFGKMDEVVFGEPAAGAVAEQSRRLGAERVFLMVSGTLNRDTDVIDNIRAALGNRCVGIFDRMPPHTPRSAVIAAAAHGPGGRADLIVTVGGGSITDGAKAVQLCLANDIRTPSGSIPARAQGRVPPIKPPSVRQISVPTTLSAGEFSAIAGVTNERPRSRNCFAIRMVDPARRDPGSRHHRAHAGLAVSVDRHPRGRSLRGGLCSREANPMPTRRR